jgi:Thermolysin metallopeptidase, alpha-helical domain
MSYSSPLQQPPILIRDFEFRCIHCIWRDPSRYLGSMIDSSNVYSKNHERVLDFLVDRLPSTDDVSRIILRIRKISLNTSCIDHCDRDWYRCNSIRQCDNQQEPSDQGFACFYPIPQHHQFFYGQQKVGNKLVSLATSLTIVAHEITHALTDYTFSLDYKDPESASICESYSDIFAVLVANEAEQDIDDWKWMIGEEHFDGTRYLNIEPTPDSRRIGNQIGNQYYLMVIHNYAAYKIITACDKNGEYLFENRTEILPFLFYQAWREFSNQRKTERGNLKGRFEHSRHNLITASQSIFVGDDFLAIVNAIEQAFDSVNIYETIYC